MSISISDKFCRLCSENLESFIFFENVKDIIDFNQMNIVSDIVSFKNFVS